jgi:hypothetical protein
MRAKTASNDKILVAGILPPDREKEKKNLKA